jgi:hypothetical protein
MHKFSYGELYDPKDSGMYWRKATCDICGFVEEQLVGCE